MTKKTKRIEVKKERRINITVNFSFILKIIIIFIFLFLIWYSLEQKYVELYIHKVDKKYESLFFSLLVSATLLLFMVGYGIQYSINSPYIKIPIIISIIYLIYLGFEYLGIGIIINKHFGLLNYITYESNSRKGISFFIHNLPLLFIIWVIHLPFISEKDD